MQDHDGNDETMVINAQRELLTADDCESIIRSDGCLVGYAWPTAEKPSPAMCQHMKKFAASVRLAALLYGNLGPEEQQIELDVRRVASDLQGNSAQRDGYLSEVRRLHDRGAEARLRAVAFTWPIQAPAQRQIQSAPSIR